MWPFTQETGEEKHRRHEETHRRAERAQWRRQNKIAGFNNTLLGISIFISSIAAGGAIYAAFYASGAFVQARDQARAAQGQLTAAVQANRAWVEIDVSPDNKRPFSFSVAGLFYSIVVSEKNVGHSPAFDVHVHSDWYVDYPFFVAQNELIKYCEKRKSAFGSVTTLFPRTSSDAFETTSTASILPQSEIERANRFTAFVHATPLPQVKELYDSYIFVCVTYRTQGDDAIRQTRIMRHVYLRDPINPERHGLFPNFGEISADRIELLPDGRVGEYAD